MRNPLLPRAQAGFLDGAGRPLAEWRRFFESLSALTTETTLQAEISTILARIAALEAAEGRGSVSGQASIVTYGQLATGLTVALAGDSSNPGVSHYYGTDVAGSKGFHELPEHTGGLLPVVTGEAPPVFVYLDDGSLLYAPAEY